MQAEESVEIENCFAWDVDAGTHGVVLRLAMRDHDIQAIRRAALKDYDQALGARAGLDCSQCGASQKAWDRGCPDDGESAIAQEYAARDGHEKKLLAFSF